MTRDFGELNFEDWWKQFSPHLHKCDLKMACLQAFLAALRSTNKPYFTELQVRNYLDESGFFDRNPDVQKLWAQGFAEQLNAAAPDLLRENEELRKALEFIAYGKDHSGVIPCPQDYNFYIKPFQDRAREALAATEVESST